MKHLLIFMSMLIVILSGLHVLAQESFDPQVSTALQTVLEDAVAAGNPGAVLWVDSPQGIFAGASGYADVEAGTAVQPDDPFRIGSVTKLFTSTVVLQLSEAGVLDLDDRLAEWLPETAATLPYGDEITLRQLLSHTAGVNDFEEAVIGNLQDSEMRQRQWQPEEIIALVSPQEAISAPGEAFSYSNAGYVLLGMVIEAATGQTLTENYHQRILDPLGMTHTYHSDFEESIGKLVRGYSQILPTDDYNASFAAGPGALVSTASDLVLFIRALMRGQLFREASTLETMLAVPQQAVLPEGYAYSLGVLQLQTPLGTWYGHNGQIIGYSSWALYAPDQDTVVIALVNADQPYVDLGAVMTALADTE